MKIILLTFLAFIVSASSINDARKANEAFKNGDFETAAELYRQAIDESPDDARLHFNLGNALAKLGESEASVRAFETAKQLMENPQQQSMADYNAGTALSEAEMYEEALAFYKNALRNNPGDPDAKHNYEMSIKKQQDQEQEEQEQQDQDSSDDQDENEDEQEQQQNQDENQDENQDQQNDQNEGSPEEQETDEQEMPQPDEITQEEAENILNALEQLEREILENRKKEAADPSSANDKDW